MLRLCLGPPRLACAARRMKSRGIQSCLVDTPPSSDECLKVWLFQLLGSLRLKEQHSILVLVNLEILDVHLIFIWYSKRTFARSNTKRWPGHKAIGPSNLTLD